MENNFNKEFQDKVTEGFDRFKKAMQTVVLTMSNFSNLIRDEFTQDSVILSCVERIKNHHICFNAEIAFDKDFIIKKLWEAGFKSYETVESFHQSIIIETEKIIQEINCRIVPKNLDVNQIIIDDYLCPKMKSNKNKKPFYKKLDRLKKWEQ